MVEHLPNTCSVSPNATQNAGSRYVAQADLELVDSSDPPASAFQGLGVQVCTTLPKKTPVFSLLHPVLEQNFKEGVFVLFTEMSPAGIRGLDMVNAP